MAESLLIRLGSQANDVIHWLITSADKQEIIGSGELANAEQLSELTEKAATRKVTILVPSCDIALKQLTVPSKSKKALKQAVPYMLEDELAEDVNKLFFAYANIKSDQANCFVAVVDHEQMALWLSWLADAEINALEMFPDALAMPLVENRYSAIALGEQIILRKAKWQAVTIDASLWQLYSDRWKTEDEIYIEHYSPLSADNQAVELVPQPEELPLFLFAKNLETCPINLLQGVYKKKSSSGNVFWQYWRVAASFVAVALLLNLTGKAIHLYQLDKQQSALQEKIQSIYQTTFADENSKEVNFNKIKSLVNFKVRVAVGEGGGEKFFPLIDKILPSFIAVKNLKPQTLQYDHKHNEIRMQALASGYQDFEAFKIELEKVDLKVSQGSQNNQGDQILGSFSIKGDAES